MLLDICTNLLDCYSSAGNLIKIIEDSRNNALKKVNEELIRMYWNVGEYLSKEAENVAFGDSYIDSVAKEIQNAFPGIKGFTRRGLYRMKQFYETYYGDEFVSALLTQISWTNHLMIMSKAKTVEERHFYITLCIKESYSSRELERQIVKETIGVGVNEKAVLRFYKTALSFTSISIFPW